MTHPIDPAKTAEANSVYLHDRYGLLETLDALYSRHLPLTEGALASYIPELTKADPGRFAISIVTVDGQIFQVGDVGHGFTIQSISKPFVYGMALQEYGRDFLAGKVGVEPTGDRFNSIIKLDATGRPHNPMVNAGAIAMTHLIRGQTAAEREARLLETLERYIGQTPPMDAAVYESEKATGHKNRAISHLMLHYGMLSGHVDDTLDLYFRQCSLCVTSKDLAVMAATLANQGQNPLTHARALDEEYIRDVLSVLFTCGMYDASGSWAFEVGLPAKSGVGGGLMAVVPGLCGIGVYSPLLDAHGHSVRGLRVCEDLSRIYGWHVFESHTAVRGHAKRQMTFHQTERPVLGQNAKVITSPEGVSKVALNQAAVTLAAPPGGPHRPGGG